MTTLVSKAPPAPVSLVARRLAACDGAGEGAAPPRGPVEALLRRREKNWPESVSPVSRLVLHLLRLGDRLIYIAGVEAEKFGLSFNEFQVLACLRGFPPSASVTPTQICEAVLMSSGGLTKVLKALEERNLIARTEGDLDKRSKPASITAAGIELIERALAAVQIADEAILRSALTETEIAAMTQAAASLLRRIEPGAAAGRGAPHACGI